MTSSYPQSAPQPTPPPFPPTPTPKKPRGGLIILGATLALIALFSVVSLAGAKSGTAAHAVPSIPATVPAAPTTAAAEATVLPTPESTEATSTAPTEEATTEATEEPTEEATEEPTEEPTEEAVDTTMKYGQTLEFTVDDQSSTLRLEAPKTAANMFDKQNIEVKTKFCNKGDETIEDLSASSLGIYAEDGDGGTYDIYGAYRKPEFPGYSMDGKKVKAGKCITGWISFDGANHRKGLHLAIDIGDNEYTWSKSGK